MTLAHSGSFRDLKQILANYGGIGEIPYEVKERAYVLCSNFIGGVWKSVPIDKMCLNRMKGGMSNMLFLVKLPEGYLPLRKEPDKALLRVYFNPETESHLVAESVIFTLLSERQLGPQLFGIFNGGRLEEYIVSRPLHCYEIRQAEISRKIAGKLAHVHKLSVPISKEPTYLCEALERWMTHLLEVAGKVHSFDIRPPGENTSITIDEDVLTKEIHTIRWMSRLIKNGSQNTVNVPLNGGKKCRQINFEDIRNELHVVRRAVGKSSSPVVFCHNDLQEGNILLPLEQSSATKDLVFIDFEYASYNYRAFDFANHFCEWMIDYAVEQAPYYVVTPDDFPLREAQECFFRTYLEQSGEPFDDANVQKLIDETASFIPVSHFFWGVWALLQVELSPVQFGFAEYGRTRLGYYFHLRPDLMRLFQSSGETAPGANGDVIEQVDHEVVNGQNAKKIVVDLFDNGDSTLE